MDLDEETLTLLGGGADWEEQVPKRVLHAHLAFVRRPAVYTEEERRERHRKSARESARRRAADAASVAAENFKNKYRQNPALRSKRIAAQLAWNREHQELCRIWKRDWKRRKKQEKSK